MESFPMLDQGATASTTSVFGPGVASRGPLPGAKAGKGDRPASFEAELDPGREGRESVERPDRPTSASAGEGPGCPDGNRPTKEGDEGTPRSGDAEDGKGLRVEGCKGFWSLGASDAEALPLLGISSPGDSLEVPGEPQQIVAREAAEGRPSEHLPRVAGRDGENRAVARGEGEARGPDGERPSPLPSRAVERAVKASAGGEPLAVPEVGDKERANAGRLENQGDPSSLPPLREAAGVRGEGRAPRGTTGEPPAPAREVPRPGFHPESRGTLDLDGRKAHLRIEDEVLGPMRWHLHVADGKVTARAVVDTGRALELLQAHRAELLSRIDGLGLEMDGFSVTVDQGGTWSHAFCSGDGGRTRGEAARRIELVEMVPDPAGRTASGRGLDLYA